MKYYKEIELIATVRAALAEPEPEGPTDEELMAMFWEQIRSSLEDAPTPTRRSK